MAYEHSTGGGDRNMTDVDEFLEHHGVRGMKWGVRRSRGSNGRVTSADHNISRDLMKRHVSELANHQIQTVNTRLGLEQNLSRLNPGAVKRGQTAAREILTVVGTATAVAALLANSPKTVAKGTAFVSRMVGPSIKKGVSSIGT